MSQETETPETRKRAKQERRQPPENCNVFNIDEILTKTTEAFSEFSTMVTDFIAENAQKTDEETGGKIGRVYLQVEKAMLTLQKTKEVTDKRITADTTASYDPDGLGPVRSKIRGLRRVINSNKKSIETLLNLSPNYDVTFLEEQNQTLETEIADTMAEHGLTEEPTRKRKNSNDEE